MRKKQTPQKTQAKAPTGNRETTIGSENEKPKDKYRVRNWASYNESLKKRGSITLWIDEDIIQAWIPDPRTPKKRGGQKEYTDGAIECLLMVKNVYHLGYR